MKNIFTKIIGTALLSSCISSPKETDLSVKLIGTMPSLESGFEKGVSACYAAVYNDALYVAGGCNFPEKPVTEGGVKRYYKGIFKMEPLTGNGAWVKVGELPMTSAYGANIQNEERWIIAGGMNENGATNQVFSININDNCSIERLPDLPYAIDNTSGTISGNRIFVAGGNIDGKASNIVFVLDLENQSEGWKELPTMPSRGRVQPVCAATQNALYVWGGFSPADNEGEAVAYTDGLCYDFTANDWKSMSDVVADGEKVTFTGATMTKVDEKFFVAAGGVNEEIFTDAISGRYELVNKSDYMHKEPEWYKFNKNLMAYDVENDTWIVLNTNEMYARAGALILSCDKGIIYVGGELKPGIRSNEVTLTSSEVF